MYDLPLVIVTLTLSRTIYEKKKTPQPPGLSDWLRDPSELSSTEQDKIWDIQPWESAWYRKCAEI